jgi:high-affinity nickel-transport protein
MVKHTKDIVLLYSLIIGLTVSAFLYVLRINQAYVLIGYLAVLAYTLGVRHGFDADHIAAIDNSTRKFLQEKKDSLTTGVWFSLGHSTVVIIMIAVLVIATKSIISNMSFLKNMGALVGTLISAVFLITIGVINLLIASDIRKLFKTSIKRGRIDSKKLDRLLSERGFFNRYLRGFMHRLRNPRDLYIVGLLFGLGFDTASEIALIAISVGVGVASANMVTVMVLPFLFTLGMVLVDTSDGILMSFAYKWAFMQPIRKLYYNFVITLTSVLIALFIGGLETLQLILQRLGVSGNVSNAIKSLDFSIVGLVIIVLLIVVWGSSALYYKFKVSGSYTSSY